VELLAATIEKEGPPGAEAVIPVPLHVKRLRQRGFNQSGLMAKMLGRTLRLSVPFGALIRQHWTEPQTRLNRQDRLTNVKGAFRVKNPSVVRDRSILLIDDVFTTGTTVTECAATLKKAGASEVHILTVARAVPDAKPD
jgi:ComF family protein